MLEITKNWTRWLPNHSKLLANFQNEMRWRKSVRLKITERTLSVTALRLNCLLLKMPFIVFITCYTMKSMIFCCFLIFIIIFIAVVQFMLLLLLGTCWDCDVYIALYQFFIPLNKRSEVFDLTFAAKFWVVVRIGGGSGWDAAQHLRQKKTIAQRRGIKLKQAQHIEGIAIVKTYLFHFPFRSLWNTIVVLK